MENLKLLNPISAEVSNNLIKQTEAKMGFSQNRHFKNVDFFKVGKGKHYLSEDHPNSIGEKINN